MTKQQSDIASAARALALHPDDPGALEAMRRALARRDFAPVDPTLAMWGQTLLLADLVIGAARAGGYEGHVRVRPEGGGLRLRANDIVDATVDGDGAVVSVDGRYINLRDEHGDDLLPLSADDMGWITEAVKEALTVRGLTLREERHELSRIEEVAVMMAAGGNNGSIANTLARVAGAGASWRSCGGSPWAITLTATDEGHAAVRAYIASAIDSLRAALP